MIHICKSRREWFGGVVYFENPGFTAFVDSPKADALGIEAPGDLPQGLFSAPLDVHMSITNRCNLRCPGCYAFCEEDPPKDMPLSRAQAIIDRLADLQVFTISFGGGEPFLHPDLFLMARYARNKGVVPNITTNGRVMDAATAEACRVFGSVHISCHQPSDLDHLVRAARFLKNSGIDLGLNVLISSLTFAELPHIWKWCAKQGISRLLLLKFKRTDNNRNCREMELSALHEQALLPLMRKLSRRYKIMPMLDCSFFPALAYHRPRRRDLEFFDVNGCVGGNAILAISTDGQYRPCSFCKTACGDALELDRAVWRKSRTLNVFRQQRVFKSCHTCDYEEFCAGGCRVAGANPCGNQ